MTHLYVIFKPKSEKKPESLFIRADGSQIRAMLKNDKREIAGFAEVRSAAMRQAEALLRSRDYMKAALVPPVAVFDPEEAATMPEEIL